MNYPSSSSKKIKSLLSFMLILFVGILSMFTFSACKLTNDSGNTDSSFDSSGRLKLTTPFVDFNKYSFDSNGNKVIDDNSGSFTWTIEYYYSGTNKDKVKDIGFDQIYLLSNFYTDKDYTTIENTGLRPTSYDSTKNCFYNGDSTALYAKVLDLNKSNISFPSYEVIVDGKYYTFRLTLNDSALKQMSFNEIVNVYNSGKKIKNIFSDVSTDHSLFSFEYRTGKNNKGNFIPCPAGLMDYYVDASSGEFKIRFNPQLEAGSTNRYMKVRAISGVSTRGDSNYSSSVAFEAYAMSFEAYSPNSSTLDYGGLSYDESKYYFAYKKTYYDTRFDGEGYEDVSDKDKNPIKALTGYFPEGRKVVVERITPLKNNGNDVTDYNYAMQSWTMNVPAENSNALSGKFPALSNTSGFSLGDNVLTTSTLAKSDAFQIIKQSSILFDLNYNSKGAVTVKDIMSLDKSGNLTSNSVVYNYSPTTSAGASYHKDQLILTSQESINGFKFYANYAKVRGFMLSGSFFAGDNFFTAYPQELEGVTINLFYKLSTGEYTNVTLSNGLTNLNRTNLDKTSHPIGIKATISGSYFKIVGLEKDDYIVFSKEGQPLNGGTYSGLKPYSFHSPLMVEREAFSSTFKALDLIKRGEYNTSESEEANAFFCDRQDVGIIGTQYAEQSNLIVNLYRLTESKNDETESVPSTYLKLLKDSNISYEVIKSVSSVEDENGYITTNIIISLILPSNATLTGYNVETLDNITKQYFTDGTNYFVSFNRYNPSTMNYDVVDINGNEFPENAGNTISEMNVTMYEVSKTKIDDSNTSITQTITSDMVIYNGKYYIYDHKEIGGNIVADKSGYASDTILFYKNSTGSTPEFLLKIVRKDVFDEKGSNIVEWYNLKYEPRTIHVKADKKNGYAPVYKIGSKILSECTASGDIYSVSTVAESYATDMRFTVGENTQNVYVYYDVKKVGDYYYYTAPIGRRDYITKNDSSSSETTVVPQNVIYFNQISNFDNLLGSKIMLGSEIYKSTSSLAKAFRNAIGSKLILNCYYYIDTVGSSSVGGLKEPTTLYFRQYLRTPTDSTETQTVVRYYDASGNIYEGNPAVDTSDGFYKTTFFVLNPSAERIKENATWVLDSNGNRVYSSIDESKYSLKENAETHIRTDDYNFKFDTTGETGKNIFSVDGVNFVYVYSDGKGKAYKADVNGNPITTDVNGNPITPKEYGIITNATANGIRKIVTMYYFDVNNPENGFVESRLYYDGEKYHRIIGSTYLYYGDTYEVNLFDVYDTADIEITFKGTDTYLNSITVETMKEDGLSVSVSETKNIKRVWNGSANIETTKNYYYFVLTSYSKYENNQETEKYYPVLETNGNKELAFNFKPQVEVIRNYVTSTADGSKPLYVYEAEETVYSTKSYLMRTAQTAGNDNVTVLGKYIVTNDQANPKIYPSFSSLLVFDESEAYILDRNASTKEANYYNMDYTSTKNAIEGFPGITLLAGLPYPNPVLSFKVKHKAYESPVINISLDVNNAYYVEIIGTNIATNETNLIRDFTTYAFRETIENLTQNDYIDKAYWVLDRANFNPVYALVECDKDDAVFVDNGKYYDYYIYTLSEDEEGNPVKIPSELTIQNIGLNSDEDYIYASTISINNRYSKKLYKRYINDDGTIGYRQLEISDVLLWKTDSTTISGAPTYDIHSYTQGKDGIIYFNSGSSNDENIICNGLNGITSGATKSSSGFYNYDNVMISGVTFAYRTLASQVNNSSNMSGYQFDKMINILNAFNSNDAYFRTGLESAVMVASPVVKLNGDDGNTYIYRFKEWKVYSRYNSEVLYYNRGETESNQDRYNAIMRFTSQNAGYYVIFPVYERVFNIDTGTAVIDGAINQGGGVQISYNNGDELDVNSSYDDLLYFVNYNRTEYQGKSGYFYGNLTGYPFLYFTGTFKNGEPVYELLDDVYVAEFNGSVKRTFGGSITSGKVPLFFKVNKNSNGVITGINFLKVITETKSGESGIIVLENNNGQYTYKGFSGPISVFSSSKGYYLKNSNKNADETTFEEIINVSFTSKFFYDSITESNISTTIPLYYDVNEKAFWSMSLGNIPEQNNVSFINTLLFYNMKYNSVLFENGSYFEAYGKSMYKGDSSTYSVNGVRFSDICTEQIATANSNIFTVIKRVQNGMINGLYVSRLGSLNAGELLKDANGNLYSTQQFKTAYIDRDSYVELRAVPQIGYRFEGWYKCIYDKDNNFWYTTNEKVTNSDDIYSDEIIQAFKNENSTTYYYVTDYKTDDKGEIKYFYDSNKKEEAIVPERMLDKVRGFFINTGSKKAPNYIQVYRKVTGLGEGNADYYYDATFINKVDQNMYDVEERTYLSSIRKSVYQSETYYYLSNVAIYYNENNQRYYRLKESGNVIIDGEVLKISKLHSNVRYVAKFIETYNEYIFAEDEDSSGILVQAVYYSNSNPKTDADGRTIIRTDIDGNNHTNGKMYDADAASDIPVAVVDRNFFNLYDEKNTKTGNLVTTQIAGQYNDYSVLNKLVNSGFGVARQTYRVNEKDPTLDGKLNLRSMYFDVDTTVTIVVRVKGEFELSIHSLGVNSNYKLEPIFCPTDEFVKANQKAKDEDKIDYLFYIFKITYNRDPANEYSNYIVHPDRGENMAYDVLVGNYDSYYKYKHINSNNVTSYLPYFDRYDSLGNRIEFVNGTLSESYLKKVCGDEGIRNTIRSRTYQNIEKALYDLCFEMKKPGKVVVKEIRLKKAIDGTSYKSGDKFTTLDSIYDLIKAIMQNEKNKKYPYLIRTGYRNFINLSTIPVFNFTVQAVLIDSEGDEIKYDEKTNKIILPTLDIKSSPVSLANSVYVAGGINNRTYLGVGEQLILSDPYQYKQYKSGENSYPSIDSFSFSEKYTGLEYAKDGNNDIRAMFQDLTFVQNTIVLFQGIEIAPASGYIFAGWYEQKFDRDTETWSDLVFMSSEETTPYISISTADTVIVAVYKRAVEVTFTFDNREMAYEMSNGLRDSAGNPLQGLMENGQYVSIADSSYVEPNGIVTLKGTFFFDAKIEAIISPAGGYRFDGISYNAFKANGESAGSSNKNILSKYFKFYNYNTESGLFEACTADDQGNTYQNARLNRILKVEFNLNTAIRTADKAIVCDKLEINLETKKLTLVYFTIENYSSIKRVLGFLRFNVHSGYNFLLIRKSTNEVLFNSNGISPESLGIDDTNSPVEFVFDKYNLSVYGYFDSDNSNDLTLITIQSETTSNTVEEWYINGNNSENKHSSEFRELNSSYSYADAYYKFDICFEYEDEALKNFNNSDFFALNKNNSVYYAKAYINTGNYVANVAHRLVEDVSELGNVNTGTIPVGFTFNTLLSFNGTLQNVDGVGQTIENGAIAAGLNQQYVFDSGATLNLKAFSNYMIYNGNLYVFVGWFHYSDENATLINIISKDSSIMGTPAQGFFEARYVRANKVVSDIQNADIIFDSTQRVDSLRISKSMSASMDKVLVTYGQIEGVDTNASNDFEEKENSLINYVLVGSSLNFAIAPTMEYIVNSCSVVGSAFGELAKTESNSTEYTNGKYYSVENITANNLVTISAVIKKGYVVKVKQTWFSNITMTGDGTSIDSASYISVSIGDNTYSALNEIVVSNDTIVSFKNTNTYNYFIGFFVNGQLVTSSEAYEKSINEDLTIEARYTDYNYFAVSSFIENTSSEVSGFDFTLTYKDPKTKQTITIRSIKTVYRIPAGVTAKISVATYASGYKFVGLKTAYIDGSTVKTLSTNSESEIVLTRDLRTERNNQSYFAGLSDDVRIVFIAAIYERTTIIKVVKDVVVSGDETYITDGEGKNVTKEQFDGMFNISLTYTDPAGNIKTISTSSKSELSRIEIEKGSSFTIIPSLDSTISHRYMIYDFDFKVSGYSRKELVTANADGSYYVAGDESFSDLVFVVYFKPCNQVTLVKEVLGSPDDENISIDYSYVNSNNATEEGVLRFDSETEFNLKEGGAFTLTANIADENRYLFIGWFNNGKLVSTEKTVTEKDITDPNTVVAKFIKIVVIDNISRFLIDVNGNEHDFTSSTDFGDVYVTGNFIEGTSYSVKTKTLAEIKADLKKGVKIVAGTKLSLATNHYSGYSFYRFRVISNGTYNEYSLQNNNANIDSDGHSAVTTPIDGDIEICVDFEKPYNITYFVSTSNTEGVSNNGFIINQSTSKNYYSYTSYKRFTFVGTLESGYVLDSVEVNGKTVQVSENNNVYTVTIPNEFIGKALVVKLNVSKETTVSVYVSLDGISDAAKFGNLGQFNIAINGSYYALPSRTTMMVSHSHIKANENVKVKVDYANGLSYTYNGITYKFDGFYLYDGTSTSTSISPILYENTFEFIANKDIAVVAKFESSKMPASIVTRYYNDNGESDFVGWFARINNPDDTNYYEDILISSSYSDKAKLNGKYSLVYAKYQTSTSETIQINGDDAKEGHAVVYSSSDLALSSKTNISVSADNKTIAVTNVYGSIQASFIASAGYEITNVSSKSCTVVKKIYNFTVITKQNRVDSNKITSGTGKDTVSISEQSKSVSLTLRIPNGINSSFFANITESTINQTFRSYSLTSTNNAVTITVPSGSIISLFYALSNFEKFSGFRITVDGNSTTYTENFMDFELPEASSVSIEILISKANTSTIYENDDNKGSASVSETENSEALNVVAVPGYSVSEILVAEISKTGEIGAFNNIFTLSNEAFRSLFGNVSPIISYSNNDSFNSHYIQGYYLTYSTDKNLAFKIAYKKITTVRFNIIVNNNIDSVITKYFNESEGPLTLAKLNAIAIADKVSSSYVLSHYLYLGEMVTDSTVIELDDNYIDIDVSFNRGYKTVVKTNLIKDTSANYATTETGIVVTLGGTTVVSTSTSYNVFEYVFSATMAVKTEDRNNYYEFVGYFSNSSDSNEYLLSAISNYTFNAIDYNKLSTEEIDGETVYVIYATLRERIQTLYIDKKYDADGFNLYFNNAMLNVTEENQIIETVDHGNVAYRIQDGKFVITYPYSILSSEFKIEVRQDNFEENRTDPILGTGFAKNVSVFYEKLIDGTYYRFDNFYNENDFTVGEKYSNSIELALKDYRIGGTITAKLIKLNQIEYISDVSDENISIKLEILTIAEGAAKYIEIAKSNNQATVQNAKIIYRAEEGTAIRVYVDFKNYAGTLSSIIFTREISNMISKLFNDSENISEIDWENRLTNKGYIAVSSFYSADNKFNPYVSADKTSAFNFTPTEDLSFIADFKGGFIDFEQRFIASTLYTPNDSMIGSKFTGAGISGTGFFFTPSIVGITFTSISDSSDKIYNNNTSYADHATVNEENFSLTSGNSATVTNGQINFHTIFNRFASITLTAQVVLKSEYGVGYKDFANFNEVSNNKNLYIGTEIAVTRTNANSNDNTSAIKHLRYDISAPAIEGYIFKGFALYSASYGHAFDVVLIGGETAVSPSEQVTMINANSYILDNGKIITFKASNVSVSGDTKIAAIYEPRVYIVTLNTYKYFEDNSGSKLVNAETGLPEEIESATIKGSLLVQRDESIKITSISYQFSQFVGLSTTNDFNNSICFAYDAGAGISVVDLPNIVTAINGTINIVDESKVNGILSDYKQAGDTTKLYAGKLSANDVAPGQKEDGTYVSSSARNNFYALNVQQDFTVNFYYTALSYNLVIDLGEVESTYSSSGNQGRPDDTNQSTYLAYSEEARSVKDWKNPSAGTYSYSTNYGTNSRTNKDCPYSITIAENDPFVYVFNDSDGTNIGYPTKISYNLVKLAPTESQFEMRLKYTTNIDVKIATTSNSEGIIKTFNFIEGIGNDDAKHLRQYGLDCNAVETNINNEASLRNIFNYLNFRAGTYSLKNNLFTVDIGGTLISSQEARNYVDIDLVNGTIQFKYKVVASETGFPKVTVTQYDAHGESTPLADLTTSIIKLQIRNVTKTTNKQKASEIQSGFQINGFNTALFEGSEQFENPNFKLDNLDVHLLMLWQTKAQVIKGIVSIETPAGGKEDFYLTGTNSYSNRDDRRVRFYNDTTDFEKDCRNNSNNYLLHNDHDEIMSYQIYIVKNGYTIADMLNKIAMYNPFKTDYNYRELVANPSLIDRVSAFLLYRDIFGEAVGKIDGYAKIENENGNEFWINGQKIVVGRKNYGTGATGQLLTYSKLLEITNLLNKYFGLGLETENDKLLFASSILTYRCIDAYELYMNGVNPNFFNNALNATDMVVSQTILSEHVYRQENHFGSGLFKKWLWTADKGFSYFRGASASYYITSNDAGTFTSDFDNAIADTKIQDTVKKSDMNIFRSIGERFNSQWSRKGTYNRFITVALAPSEDEFNNPATATVTISHKKDPVITSIFDYSPLPIVNGIFGLLFSSPLTQLIDGVVKIINPDSRTIFDFMTNIW